MKNATLITIMLIGTALNGCHHGNNNNTTYIDVNAALKAAFNYKVGTYWIYQDSLNGEVDSFFVQSNSDTYPLYSTGSGSPALQIYMENIVINVIESNISPIFPANPANWNFDYFENEITLNCFIGAYDNLIYYAPFINYPYDSELSGSSVDGHLIDTGQIIDTNNQFVVQGQTHQNVIEVNHYSNMTINGINYIYNDTFFVAPDVGMIKMILHHPLDSLNKYRIWELQRYNLVK